MAKLIKRGSVWHYDFRFQKVRYQGSTFLKNKEKAESFVASLRTNLALGLAGLKQTEPPPTLKAFLEGPFLTDVRQNCEKPRTIAFYTEKAKVICDYARAAITRLDAINDIWVNAYKGSRIQKGLAVDTINGEIRTLRKALIYADNCGLVRYKTVKELPGANKRDFILDRDTESRFLEVARFPLREVAILMLDLGLRPEECVRLRKADISHDTLLVRQGKTRSAHRELPLTNRTRSTIDLCSALFPDSEWLFPGSKGSHYTRGAIDNLFTAVRDANEFPKAFVLYSCRHTFATKLAQSCNGDLFVLMKALGHADTKMCQRYVHVQPDYLRLAMTRKETMDRMVRGEVNEHLETSSAEDVSHA